MTDRYAVIGNPIAHSKSPRIHALFAAQTSQDLVYEAMLAPLDGFAAAIHAFFAAGGRGANVTVPFKEDAFRVSNRLTMRAKAAAAVNTLAFSESEILGDNTDGAGLVRDLTVHLDCSIGGKRILLLGAGGAARGALLPLLEQRPQALVIANRNSARAEKLAATFGAQFMLKNDADEIDMVGCGFAELDRLGSFDIIINATAAGLTDSALALPQGLFASGSLAYEMVYGRQTPFMHFARAQGAAKVVDGLGMLIEQAAESFLLWRGVRPDTAEVFRMLRRELQAS